MNKEFIHKLTEIVVANMANESFGTEDLAREMGMSHSNLHRKLKAISNQTISQFIRETRLKKAKELLLNEDITVAETAYRVGFGSPTYFNKCFHEFFGHAPGELRKEEQWSEREIPVENTPKKRNQTKALIILFLTFIILIPLFVFLLDKTKSVASLSHEEKSIAVLPFKCMSGEVDKQYLADGMMDAILLHLSKIKDLRVISRTSVEQYRSTHKTISQIGKDLQVAYLLEGSFQKEGDKIRLILQLLKTKDEGHVWSSDYDRDWKDVFLVQSEVAETIASELDAAITPEEKQRIHKIPTEDLTAYDFYQRGNDAFPFYDIIKGNKKIDLSKAKSFYKKALVLDSTYAQAYLQLSSIAWVERSWNTYFSEEFLDSAIYFANKAIHFDNDYADGYIRRAFYYWATGNLDQMKIECNKALSLNPKAWEAYRLLGLSYQLIYDDFIKAISYFNEAIIRQRGRELPYLLEELGQAYLDAGFIEKAKYYWGEALKLHGDSALYFCDMALLESCNEDFVKALDYAKKAYSKDTLYVFDLPLYHAYLGLDKEAFSYTEKYAKDYDKHGYIVLNTAHRIGYSLWQAGKYKEARYFFNQQLKNGLESIKLKRANSMNRFAYYDLAATYAFIGEKAAAYQCLDEFNKKKAYSICWVTFLKHDPLFAKMRGEQRFQNILHDVEGKFKAENERVKQWLLVQHRL